MNARMYAVTPEVEAAWAELLHHICRDAGVALDYYAYPAPNPLETLWKRPDLGCVFMCGYPIALQLADIVPLAAPIPRADWAKGRAVYRSDLIIRKDAPYQRLEDTFGGSAGWTVEHSQSGFNAFRHHLLGFRNDARAKLYEKMLGPLVTARKILDSVLAGTIDIGPLDAYWHALIAKHRPELTESIRVLASTALAPMPAFVAASSMPTSEVMRLKVAFTEAASRPWFKGFRDTLLLDGFSAVTATSFASTLVLDEEARAAGYAFPG